MCPLLPMAAVPAEPPPRDLLIHRGTLRAGEHLDGPVGERDLSAHHDLLPLPVDPHLLLGREPHEVGMAVGLGGRFR